MKRRTLFLSLAIFLVAIFAGPSPPIFASHHDHGDSRRSSRHHGSEFPAPPPAVPASEPAHFGPGFHDPGAPNYLVLRPDIDVYYAAPWADDFYWGWPYYSPLLPYGYWYAPPSPYLEDQGYLEVERSEGQTALDLHVHPWWKAKVVVDGKPLGKARYYDSWSDRLNLRPGKHVVEIEAPGYRTLRIDLDARKGDFYSLHYTLKRGKGLDPRSPEDYAARQALGPVPTVRG